MTGVQTNGTIINLGQLQNEITAAGASVGGLGSDIDSVYGFDADGLCAGDAAGDERSHDSSNDNECREPRVT